MTEEKEKNTKGGRKNIDWQSAFRFYCLPDEKGQLRSYSDVAKKFEVSEVSVETHGSNEGWVKLRENLGRKETAQFLEDRAEAQKQANLRQFAAYQEMQRVLKNELLSFGIMQETNSPHRDVGDLKKIAEAFKLAMDGERVILGLPTSVSKSEVDNKIRTLGEVLDDLDKKDPYEDYSSQVGEQTVENEPPVQDQEQAGQPSDLQNEPGSEEARLGEIETQVQPNP
ncbi:MAG TPA: hypothetical protein VD999_05680 [Vitreimonas sp.]|nr:hypothetical protein [Vitreimonas sp.]